MAVDTNSTPLEQPLTVRSGLLAADIRTISDAAKFIRNLPDDFAGRIHWQLTCTALEAADKNPSNAESLRTATLALKNALATERMLAPSETAVAVRVTDDNALLQILDQSAHLWLVRGGPIGILGQPCPTLRSALQQAHEHSSGGESPGPIVQMPDDAIVVPVEQIYRLWRSLGYVDRARFSGAAL